MLRCLRTLTALFLVAAGLVLAVQTPAAACSCAAASTQKQVQRADVVFLGTIEGVTKGERLLEYAVTATRSWKGRVDSEVVVQTAAQASACGLEGLTEGRDYVFLADGASSPYSSSVCQGTARAGEDRVAKIESILGTGEALPPPPPPKATRTRVEDSGPPTFTRLAAPGGAAVLLGLLGLVVVRRLR